VLLIMKRELTDSVCKAIFDAARKQLLSNPEVNEALIEKYLNSYKNRDLCSIEGVLEGILHSVKNKQGMPKTISDEDVKELKFTMCDYNPTRILEEFQNDYKQVFKKIVSEFHPKGNLDINNKRSYWVLFCKAVISASIFLKQFETIKDFNQFVERFYLNEYTRVALPLLLEKEIDGIGFALACDFLKENGYPKFVKPDVHIIEIFHGIGLSDSEEPYQVFKDVLRFSEKIGEIPFRVDKLFWLVGKGEFEDEGIKIKKDRDDFIREARKLLND
jgi:hypothetical protein